MRRGWGKGYSLLGLHGNSAAYNITGGAIAVRIVYYDSSTFFTGVFLSLVLSQLVHLTST